MADYNLSITAQQWVNLILIWIGFATIIGLAVRSILPGREPSGLIGTLLIGILGGCVGPLVVTMVWKVEHFNPISPIGFCASAICAFVFLLVYRIIFFLFLRKNGPV
ncbi:MAG: GlsB/YeaQ/YmgE family stress response membrane protein [Planctomycetaceae bacterium]|nr:GlsB/YeaQ/YmgE family stress response membrane protein [Planctomycetaceae bacterium]